MIKTQIQIPDGLYKRIKSLAAEQEWSVAETLRRGVELLLATRPMAGEASLGRWSLEAPANARIRFDPFADEDWRLAANLGTEPANLAGIQPR